MKHLTRLIFSLLLFSLAYSVVAATIVNNQGAKKKLLGEHSFGVQWLGDTRPGTVTVTEKDGQFYIKGQQKGTAGAGVNDYVTIDGTITKINKRNFVFNGEISIKVNFIADGKPCVRNGEMTFRISGKRKYWRLKENANPCGTYTDYVDIYF